MVKKEPTHLWVADVEIETLNPLGFAVEIREQKDKKTGKKIKTINIDNWANGQGEILFDTGKRLRGWTKQALATVRGKESVAYKRAQHGFVAKTTPTPGFTPIGTLEELQGKPEPAEHIENVNKPPLLKVYPFQDHGLTEEGGRRRSFFAYYYLLPAPRTLTATVTSFVKGIDPEMIEALLREVGQHSGIGDRHSQGQGLFRLNKFEIVRNIVIA